MTGTEHQGNRLTELREKCHWQRDRIMGACGVTERTVYRWEGGETPIPHKHIATLASLFGVSREYLMGWDRDVERAAA